MSRSAAAAVATAAAATSLAAALYLRHRRRKPSPPLSSSTGSLPDCICDVCMAEIGSDQPRYRCAAPSDDNFHACTACATQPQLVAAHCQQSHRLFRERRSAYASILAVHDGRPGFTDAPLAAGAPPPPTTAAVLTRALDAFADQPCLGEVDVAGAAVLWTTYTLSLIHI